MSPSSRISQSQITLFFTLILLVLTYTFPLAAQAASFAGGSTHSAAVQADGTVLTWGGNTSWPIG